MNYFGFSQPPSFGTGVTPYTNGGFLQPGMIGYGPNQIQGPGQMFGNNGGNNMMQWMILSMILNGEGDMSEKLPLLAMSGALGGNNGNSNMSPWLLAGAMS